MSEPKRGLSPEKKAEMRARLLAALEQDAQAKAQPKPKRPTAAERAEARFAGKSDEARLQDIVAHSTDAERYFEEQVRKQEAFEEERIRLANDDARSRHMDAAYRRAQETDRVANGSYYRAAEALQATRQARMLQSRYVGFNIGRNDSDCDLHLSPEQQIWK